MVKPGCLPSGCLGLSHYFPVALRLLLTAGRRPCIQSCARCMEHVLSRTTQTAPCLLQPWPARACLPGWHQAAQPGMCVMQNSTSPPTLRLAALPQPFWQHTACAPERESCRAGACACHSSPAVRCCSSGHYGRSLLDCTVAAHRARPYRAVSCGRGSTRSARCCSGQGAVSSPPQCTRPCVRCRLGDQAVLPHVGDAVYPPADVLPSYTPPLRRFSKHGLYRTASCAGCSTAAVA